MTDEYEVIEVPPPTLGNAEVTSEEDHTSHTFLYIPDLSVETGWSTHRVPERPSERRSERRAMGFHR